MSTIAVVRKGDTIAIASDTLTKYGYVKESARYVVNHSKIIPVGTAFVAVTGPTSGKQVLAEIFGKMKPVPDLSSPASIFRVWREVHHEMKERFFLRVEEDEEDDFESSRMDILIAAPTGIFGVAPDRTVQEFSRYYALGQGAHFALGALYVAYDDPNRSAKELAHLAVEAAAEFDDATGLPIVSHTLVLR